MALLFKSISTTKKIYIDIGDFAQKKNLKYREYSIEVYTEVVVIVPKTARTIGNNGIFLFGDTNPYGFSLARNLCGSLMKVNRTTYVFIG